MDAVMNITQARTALNTAIAVMLSNANQAQEAARQTLEELKDDMLEDQGFYMNQSDDLRDAIGYLNDANNLITKIREAYPLPNTIAKGMGSTNSFEQVTIEQMHEAMGQY